MKTTIAVLLVLSASLIQPRFAAAEPVAVLAVEALGCVLCDAGQTTTFRVKIANPDGVPRTLHLLAQIELPNGDIVPLVDGPILLQSRFTTVSLFSRVVTGGDPAGTYWIDAALFDEDVDFFDAYSLRADKLD